ncbi:GH3 auxin-responsive promoter family protein [Actinomadura graeca]|uniref:GH3 auxin-responsive promoter family protein n=1 Tax=Actinomadura graeca TaxID=2750812 RepID=A0ABX8QW98_9ACTN|nr:GH3 auxin-responsive promoter family protein [Actinomadura graeca]QXJ22254.1 GH3 auxin-responsive promoter family protein [Actinomadura graeca]
MSATPAGRASDFRRRARAELAGFREALADPEAAQSAVLAAAVEANAESAFGRTHGFSSVRNADDYRAAVPIRAHEELAPWLDRVINGEPGVLSSEDPIVYFSSSGTTGVEKRIPVTVGYLRQSFLPFYFAGLATAVEYHPGLTAADDSVLNLWQDPYSRMGRTEGGRPHIGPSQIDYKRIGEDLATGLGNRAPWSRLPEEFDGSDPWERTYLRLRLAAEHDVRAVVAVNPAIAAALPYQLGLWWPRIVKEIHDGTLGGTPLRDPDPARARLIEDAARRSGTVRPCDLWPRLEVLLAWTTYVARLYLPWVAQEYGPRVRVLPTPLGSCEGPLAAPVDRHLTAAPLVTPSCFYEFVPAEDEVRGGSPTLLAHELEKDRDYHVVLSHVGGLYRCATRDVVRVAGFVGRTPRVEYLGRDGTLSAAGERLREHQVLRALSGAVSDTGLEVRNMTWRLDPAPAAAPAHQAAVAVQGRVADTELRALTHALDTRLAEESADYGRARDEGALGPPGVVPVSPELFFEDWRRRVEAGERPPRVKDRVFQPSSPLWDRLSEEARTGEVRIGEVRTGEVR